MDLLDKKYIDLIKIVKKESALWPVETLRIRTWRTQSRRTMIKSV